MSVRRLAADQPASFAFTPATHGASALVDGEISARAQSLGGDPDHVAGAEAGRLGQRAGDPGDRRDLLDMPKIRVLEVATFYTMFHLHPVGKHHLQVCGTTPCMLRGAEELKAGVQAPHRRQRTQPSADGKFSWEEMECLGACVNAPVVAIDDYYHEDLTPTRSRR